MKKLDKTICWKILFQQFLVLGLGGAGFWLFVAGVAGLFMRSWEWFWYALIGLPVLVVVFLTYRSISGANAAYNYMIKAIFGKLGRVDYFNAGEHGAIAVDAGERRIATISKSGKRKYTEPCVFGVDDIRSYKSYAPGHEVFSGGEMRDYVRAMNSSAEAHRKSGIYIDIDNLKVPQVFVQMDYEEAEKWHLVLEKLRSGMLEKQVAPMLFPQP